MKTYTAVIECDEDLELFIQIPDEIIQETGWGLNDTLEWIDNKDGTWSLVKTEERHSQYYYDTERNK